MADTGFIEAELLLESARRCAIDLLGPVRADYHRQAREGQGFAAQDFVIDWETQHATCPAGQTSLSWKPALDSRRHDVIKLKFSRRDCQPCRHRLACTTAPRRTLTIHPKEQHEALMRARARQQTPEFKSADATRAGIEGPSRTAFVGVACDAHVTSA